jgi:hypothetical protein
LRVVYDNDDRSGLLQLAEQIQERAANCERVCTFTAPDAERLREL